jgi:hypothetical protein
MHYSLFELAVVLSSKFSLSHEASMVILYEYV